jgi:hypothetical protein
MKDYLSLDRSNVTVRLGEIQAVFRGKAGLDAAIMLLIRGFNAPVPVNYGADTERRDADFELLTRTLRNTTDAVDKP